MATGTTSRPCPRSARPATRSAVTAADAPMLKDVGYDVFIDDAEVIEVGQLRLERHPQPGPHARLGELPGAGRARCCSAATRCSPAARATPSSTAADFATIIDSIDNKLFTLPAHTIVMPGHGVEHHHRHTSARTSQSGSLVAGEPHCAALRPTPGRPHPVHTARPAATPTRDRNIVALGVGRGTGRVAARWATTCPIARRPSTSAASAAGCCGAPARPVGDARYWACRRRRPDARSTRTACARSTTPAMARQRRRCRPQRQSSHIASAPGRKTSSAATVRLQLGSRSTEVGRSIEPMASGWCPRCYPSAHETALDPRRRPADAGLPRAAAPHPVVAQRSDRSSASTCRPALLVWATVALGPWTLAGHVRADGPGVRPVRVADARGGAPAAVRDKRANDLVGRWLLGLPVVHLHRRLPACAHGPPPRRVRARRARHPAVHRLPDRRAPASAASWCATPPGSTGHQVDAPAARATLRSPIAAVPPHVLEDHCRPGRAAGRGDRSPATGGCTRCSGWRRTSPCGG